MPNNAQVTWTSLFSNTTEYDIVLLIARFEIKFFHHSQVTGLESKVYD